MKILLASASPRRRELLKKLFSDFDVTAVAADENYRGATPSDTVTEIAKRKGEAVKADYDLIIAADTMVFFGERHLGKPKDTADAFQMLSMLNGKTHTVVTGVYLRTKETARLISVSTSVTFDKKSDEELKSYIRTHKVLDKAGAYAIQDGVLVKSIDGDYDNVVGLPVEAIRNTLEKMGCLHE